MELNCFRDIKERKMHVTKLLSMQSEKAQAEDNWRSVDRDDIGGLANLPSSSDPPTVTKHEIRKVASSYRPIHFKDCGPMAHNIQDVAKVLSQKVSPSTCDWDAYVYLTPLA